ncbi:MAG: hypothetical protein CMQ46_06535 [Gammaproteobacteria bacterium]|nr:hypothetical protein [Gammaproteobacteria bacterium]MBJ54900.1 hypothetical protein [Gammaproteobacteria bacterium]HBN13804.1 hypothetical protein [Pseudohongiella sp.]|tara:strand:+ start:945 stop:1613 length:669 start_codon:yes stop_codon:yes gene_type:complete
MNSVIVQLVKKDLSLRIRLVPIVILAGLVSLATIAIESVGPIISSVLYITTLVAFSVLIGMYNVTMERDKQVQLFVLSLPVSHRQYTISKTLSSLLLFMIPWIVLTAASLAAIVLLAAEPDGLIVFMLPMQLYFAVNFCIFLAVMLVTSSEKIVISTIILTNMGITLVINLLMRMPSIAQSMSADLIVWPADVVLIVLLEIAACVLLPLAAVVTQNKKQDVI